MHRNSSVRTVAPWNAQETLTASLHAFAFAFAFGLLGVIVTRQRDYQAGKDVSSCLVIMDVRYPDHSSE